MNLGPFLDVPTTGRTCRSVETVGEDVRYLQRDRTTILVKLDVGEERKETYPASATELMNGESLVVLKIDWALQM